MAIGSKLTSSEAISHTPDTTSSITQTTDTNRVTNRKCDYDALDRLASQSDNNGLI